MCMISTKNKKQLPEWSLQRQKGSQNGDCTVNASVRAHEDKAFCCAKSVVLAAGHPFPDPFKFCNVINAAVIRVLSLCFELSVGNETFTEGLFSAFPA